MYHPKLVLEGKKHDAGMLADSRLLDDLQQHAFSQAGHPMCLYGDPVYPLRIHLQAPFRLVVPNQDMEVSAVRFSVEKLFGDIWCHFFQIFGFQKKSQDSVDFSWLNEHSCSHFEECTDLPVPCPHPGT